jgi:hypothetical protein
MNPLWNSLVIGGLQDGQPFLGCTDKLGVAFTEDAIATGYGAYIALVKQRRWPKGYFPAHRKTYPPFRPRGSPAFASQRLGKERRRAADQGGGHG